MKTRLISMLLAALMLLTLVPVTALAETPDAPVPGVGYVIDYLKETLVAEEGYEVSAASGTDVKPLEGNKLVFDDGTSYYVRVKASGTDTYSSWTNIEVPTRPDEPNVDGMKFVGTTETITIDGAENCEFSLNSGESWDFWSDDKTGTAFIKGPFEEGGSVNLLVRYKATPGYSFASKPAHMTVKIAKDGHDSIFDIFGRIINKIFGGTHVSKSAVLKITAAAAAVTAATTAVKAVTAIVAANVLRTAVFDNPVVSNGIRMIETAMILNVARHLMYGFGE